MSFKRHVVEFSMFASLKFRKIEIIRAHVAPKMSHSNNSNYFLAYLYLLICYNYYFKIDICLTWNDPKAQHSFTLT